MNGYGGWQLKTGDSIASGAFGAVFEVWRNAPGTEVVQKGALKVLKSPDDPIAQKMLGSEIQTYATLSNTHIPRFHGTGLDDQGNPWFIVDFVEGKTLVKVFESTGPLNRTEALQMCRDLTEALIETHSKNLKHLDIKADNVMKTNSGSWMLLDFGLSTKQYSEGHGMTNKIYSAPEQFDLANAITPAADIFSLALTVYYSMTGENPYDVYYPMFYTDAVKSKGPSLSKAPEDIRDLLGMMLHTNPTLRPTAAEVHSRCLELLGGPISVSWYPDRIKTWGQLSDLVATCTLKGANFTISLTQPGGAKTEIRLSRGPRGWTIGFDGEVSLGRVISPAGKSKLTELGVRMLRDGNFETQTPVDSGLVPETVVGITRFGLDFSLAELSYRVL